MHCSWLIQGALFAVIALVAISSDAAHVFAAPRAHFVLSIVGGKAPFADVRAVERMLTATLAEAGLHVTTSRADWQSMPGQPQLTAVLLMAESNCAFILWYEYSELARMVRCPERLSRTYHQVSGTTWAPGRDRDRCEAVAIRRLQEHAKGSVSRKVLELLDSPPRAVTSLGVSATPSLDSFVQDETERPKRRSDSGDCQPYPAVLRDVYSAARGRGLPERAELLLSDAGIRVADHVKGGEEHLLMDYGSATNLVAEEFCMAAPRIRLRADAALVRTGQSAPALVWDSGLAMVYRVVAENDLPGCEAVVDQAMEGHLGKMLRELMFDVHRSDRAR